MVRAEGGRGVGVAAFGAVFPLNEAHLRVLRGGFAPNQGQSPIGWRLRLPIRALKTLWTWGELSSAMARKEN